MLNKELLMATESQIAGHIKLTVGYGAISKALGYIPNENEGSINRIPTWNKDGNPIQMFTIRTYPKTHNSVIIFYKNSKVDANSITMTVVEKKLTVALYWDTHFYEARAEIFDLSDKGKTFTIVFDPEPTGYV